MSKSIWVVKTRCTDPAREAEFNRWYDEVHLPDLLTVPGIVAAQRYKLAGPPGQGEPGVQYLALYEIDSDDPQAVVRAWRTEYRPKWQAAGRGIDCIAAVSLTTFTALGERQVAKGKSGAAQSVWFVQTRCTDPAREADFNRWYDEVHLPDVLTLPAVVAARRYKLVGPPSQGEPTAQYLAIYELDTDAPQKVMDEVRANPRTSTHGGPALHESIEIISGVSFTALGARQEAKVVAAGD